MRAGEVLVLDPAVVLHASRAAADYQVAGRATCGTVGGAGNGCRPFISLSSHSGLASSAATGLSRGRVDGRGDLPILGGTASWWQVAASAKQAGKQNVPRLVAATRADDVTLHDVDLVDSPGTHVSFDHGDGLTVWGVRIRTPAGARNTDGIDPAGATDVTIAPRGSAPATTASPSRRAPRRRRTSASSTTTSSARTASRSAARRRPG